MERPRPGATEEKGIAKLRLTGGAVGKIAEGAVEGFDAGGGAGIDHLGDRVVPKILLKSRPRAVRAGGVGDDFVIRVTAADTRRLHRPRGGKVGGAETHAVHARRCGRDGGDVVDTL